jgi:hypothetical protein
VPLICTLSRTKSIGRLPRSVEMMTQRPVMGSLRSSGKLSSSARNSPRVSAIQRANLRVCCIYSTTTVDCWSALNRRMADFFALAAFTMPSQFRCALNAFLCRRTQGFAPGRVSLAREHRNDIPRFRCGEREEIGAPCARGYSVSPNSRRPREFAENPAMNLRIRAWCESSLRRTPKQSRHSRPLPISPLIPG